MVVVQAQRMTRPSFWNNLTKLSEYSLLIFNGYNNGRNKHTIGLWHQYP